MIRILILGATGMLGQSLSRIGKSKGYQIFGLARTNSDFNSDIRDDCSLRHIIKDVKPTIIINTIAVIDLLFCEKNPDICYMINTRPLSVLSEIARIDNICVVQISTDHYYRKDGKLKHSEDDKVTLLNEYSKTKYLAEKIIELHQNHIIARTNIVGFRGIIAKKTFLEWLLEILQTDEQATLYDDYYTSSIDVDSFSKIVYSLLEKNITGLFNIASQDISSKYEFAVKFAEEFNLPLNNKRVGSIKENTGVLRGDSLGLDVSKISKTLRMEMPKLDKVIHNLHIQYMRYYGNNQSYDY